MSTLVERFWPKVNKTEGCWVWMASLTAQGYGQISGKPLTQSPLLAHRVSWEFANGPIPTSMQIDHLCRNRRCVNPSHMEVVDNRTNTLRGIGLTAVNARKTVCKRGHQLSAENVRIWRGMRFCLQCCVIRAAERRRRLANGTA